MSTHRLPIEIIPNTNPPKFKWERIVESPIGRKTIECEGLLPSSVEGAVVVLITLVNTQAQEIEQLKKIVQGLADRVAAQSELLSKKAEVQQPIQTTQATHQTTQPVQPTQPHSKKK